MGAATLRASIAMRFIALLVPCARLTASAARQSDVSLRGNHYPESVQRNAASSHHSCPCAPEQDLVSGSHYPTSVLTMRLLPRLRQGAMCRSRPHSPTTSMPALYIRVAVVSCCSDLVLARRWFLVFTTTNCYGLSDHRWFQPPVRSELVQLPAQSELVAVPSSVGAAEAVRLTAALSHFGPPVRSEFKSTVTALHDVVRCRRSRSPLRSA